MVARIKQAFFLDRETVEREIDLIFRVIRRYELYFISCDGGKASLVDGVAY